MNIVDPPSPGIVTKHIWVPDSIVFTSAQPASALVLHKTASAGTAEDIANFFAGQNNPDGRSAHFVVGQDGEVVQCVHLVDGAGANCCVESGYDSFWDQYSPMYVGTHTGTNLNTLTISIEHCDPASDNSTPLTAAQQQASFNLIAWLVNQYGFDITTQVKGHNTLDPQSRARCPGNYPWSTLLATLKARKQAAIDTWNATGLYLPMTSDIAKSWLGRYYAGIFAGPPISKEVPGSDLNGAPIIRQWFAYEWCEWYGSYGKWYNEHGEVSS